MKLNKIRNTKVARLIKDSTYHKGYIKIYLDSDHYRAGDILELQNKDMLEPNYLGIHVSVYSSRWLKNGLGVYKITIPVGRSGIMHDLIKKGCYTKVVCYEYYES